MSYQQTIARVSTDPRTVGRSGPLGKLVVYNGGAVPVLLIKTDAAVDTAYSLVGELGIVAPLSISTAELADLAATTAKINDLAVTTAKIDALAVTNGKIGALAVDAGKIAADAVTTAKILDANVTLAKMANLAAATVIGSIAGGVPAALTAAQVQSLLNTSTGRTVTWIKKTTTQVLTSATPADITGLLLPVVAGRVYMVTCTMVFSTSNTSEGAAVGATFPATTHAALFAEINVTGVDGTNQAFQGLINASGDFVVGNASPAGAAEIYVMVHGLIQPSASGNFQITAANETGLVNVTQQLAVLQLEDYGA